MKQILLYLLLGLTTLLADFNFGECSGSGTFEQKIIYYNGDYEKTALVGTIPVGIQGLRIELISDSDVDIRLYGENEDRIVHWPYGILGKSFEETKHYKDVNVIYSGYNGVDGQKGHEFIEVNGTTPTVMTMKAFGFQAGYATVNYSWTGKEGCTPIESGDGNFTQTIEENATTLVGTVPPHVNNLQIDLKSSNDIDIQLYGEDGTAIVSWKPKGLLFGDRVQSIEYHGMTIEWSGYNGVNAHAGNEYIKVRPETTEILTMKVFGYKAGVADVTYSWGDVDTVAPVITLLGELTVEVMQGDKYTDAGATATDDKDGNITSKIEIVGSVDTSTVGKYAITYNVTDEAGNKAVEVTRTVKVKATVKPETCNNNHTWELNFDTDPTTYNWDYDRESDTLFDTSKLSNGVWKASNWDLLDTTPNFEFNQPTIMKIKMQNTSVGGKGAVAWINVESTKESAAALYLSLMLQEDGTQTLKLINSLENSNATELASIENLPNKMIEIFVSVEPDTDIVKLWVENEYKGSFTYTRKTWSSYDAFATVLAWGSTAEFEYVKIQSCSNAIETPEETEITDTTPPVITLIGSKTVNVVVGDTYNDKGATATDNVDGNLTADIIADGLDDVDTSKVGTYTVIYTVFDTSGNEANATRTVVVKKPSAISPDAIDITSQSLMNKYGMDALVADGIANDTDNLNKIAHNKDITNWYIPQGKIVRLCRAQVPSHVEKIWGKGTIRAYTLSSDVGDALQHGALEIFKNPKTKLEITGLTFDAIGKQREKKNYGLISIFQDNAVHNIEIDNCTFKDSSNLNGIKVFADTSKGSMHKNFKIHHNEFCNIGGFFAIELVNLGPDGSGDSYPNLHVNNNYIHNVDSPIEGHQNPRGAISIMRSKGETSHIHDNLIVDTAMGIEAAECQGTLIYNNKLLKIRGQAISTSGNLDPSNTKNVKIHNNHFETTSSGAVYAYGGSQAEFYDNYIKGLVLMAIQTHGNSMGEVYRNTIVSQDGHAMQNKAISVNGDIEQILSGSIRDNLFYSDRNNGSGIVLTNVSESVEVLSNKVFLKDSNGDCLIAGDATQSNNSCVKNYSGSVPNSREGAGLSIPEHEVGVQ